MLEKYKFMKAKAIYISDTIIERDIFKICIQLLFFSNVTMLQDDTAFRFAIATNNLAVFWKWTR